MTTQTLLVMLQRVLDEVAMTEDGLRKIAPLTYEQARQAIQKAEEKSND